MAINFPAVVTTCTPEGVRSVYHPFTDSKKLASKYVPSMHVKRSSNPSYAGEPEAPVVERTVIVWLTNERNPITVTIKTVHANFEDQQDLPDREALCARFANCIRIDYNGFNAALSMNDQAILPDLTWYNNPQLTFMLNDLREEVHKIAYEIMVCIEAIKKERAENAVAERVRKEATERDNYRSLRLKYGTELSVSYAMGSIAHIASCGIANLNLLHNKALDRQPRVIEPTADHALQKAGRLLVDFMAAHGVQKAGEYDYMDAYVLVLVDDIPYAAVAASMKYTLPEHNKIGTPCLNLNAIYPSLYISNTYVSKNAIIQTHRGDVNPKAEMVLEAIMGRQKELFDIDTLI